MQIFINNRNWVTWPKAMASQLSNEGHDITFIDNGSTYEPLLDFYEACDYKVIKLPNLGAQAAWDAAIVTQLRDFYVVTDPDYDLSMIPKDWPEQLMEGFAIFPGLLKCGFSWDESQVPQENPAWILDDMYKYPEGNPLAWGNKLVNNFYNYPCDTSFAIYRPGIPFSINGIRKGRPYTGVHLPWHITLDPSKDPTKRYVLMDEESYYYFTHCEKSSCTHGRMADMLKAYKERHNL